MHEKLERKAVYPVDLVMSKLPKFNGEVKKRRINFYGDMLYIDSMRYYVFQKNNCTCTKCGMVGKFFAKEKHPKDKSYHLNLYGFDKDGNEVLMTKDHHIPVSKGGSDDIRNLNTMCCICNEAKGNLIPKE